ncbi:actin-related protein 2/3 complex subunit 2B isoform X2 [Beta vulgaris subsp. vulgaris]|uniref:actin-related protein 2/3 complex subunit 2B isoform X2 n=1 Tax=Beta vulgaris subsp. vulgaris TaxID=3555 RepID=UPI002036F197|nr:actin-related protein 2/3 complex subunit 2B isoform X2 [Beta vulgaris subsp. vulgaris]
MACFGLDGLRKTRLKNGFFERSSPALQQVLLQLFRAQKPMEIDHRLYEFGSVEYYVQSSASDPQNIYLSISTPILSPRTLVSQGLCPYTIQKVKDISPDVVDILHPARDGYQLTLQLKFVHIPQGKDGAKIIKEIAAVASVILSSQLKEMLRNFSSEDASEGTYKPIKCIYHPREPLFVIRQPKKVTVVFPMRFKETSDVVIATSFFQELMDIGSSEAFAKAPPCTWSPIPPPELRGELMEDLSTNGGFVSFDIFSRHVDDKRLDNTVWNLLNFYTYVKSHIKSTKGFIQRKMRRRLDDLVKILHQPDLDEDDNEQQVRGCGWKMKPVSSSRFRKLRKQYGDFKKKIKRTRYRIRIHGFSELNNKIKRIHHRIKIHDFGLHRQWFSTPKLKSANKYTRLG